jgi:hypothetical protein
LPAGERLGELAGCALRHRMSSGVRHSPQQQGHPQMTQMTQMTQIKKTALSWTTLRKTTGVRHAAPWATAHFDRSF